jgi:hypothetical protein
LYHQYHAQLQYALPDARVVYNLGYRCNHSNLTYAQRLGLWATSDMPFDNQVDFVAQMEKDGIAAIEVISRDLKEMGLYFNDNAFYTYLLRIYNHHLWEFHHHHLKNLFR